MVYDWSEADEREIDEALGRIPPQLCIYRGLSGERSQHAQDMIVRSTFWAAQPKGFNDPLDCAIPPLFDGSEDEIRTHWRQSVSMNYPNEEPDAQARRVERFVESSQRPELHPKLAEIVIGATTSRYGIICLTPFPDAMLMWSHYAEKHCGICLVFHSTPEYIRALPGMSCPLEVKYREDFPAINYFKATPWEFTRTLLSTKSCKWEYEREWRILFANHTGPVKFPGEMLAKIVVGSRTSDAQIADIRAWNQQRARPVPLYQIRHRERSFQLDLGELWIP